MYILCMQSYNPKYWTPPPAQSEGTKQEMIEAQSKGQSLSSGTITS